MLADGRARRRHAGDRLAEEQVFPGLRAGEKLSAKTRMPPRAAIQTRDGR